MNINNIIEGLNLEPEKVVNIYCYGSKVYGTSNENSDDDYIIVYKQKEFKLDSIHNLDNTINATIYSPSGFKNDLYYHHISCLECLWLEPEMCYINEDYLSGFKVDKFNLRKSLSETASNSFVKAKKKIQQGDFYIGQKSLFHSIRIFDFGIQIMEKGRIYDYKRDFKTLLDDIMKYEDWNDLKKKYRKVFNEYHSKFKIETK